MAINNIDSTGNPRHDQAGWVPAARRAGGGPHGRPRFRTARGLRSAWGWLALILPLLVIGAGCAKYNTYHNAKRSFDLAENVRKDALKKHQDPPKPGGTQQNDYETAIKKAQKLLDEYPGHSLTDDALFLQAKAHHRLESYRQSIRKFNLLFQNYPATPYMEEALYLQALNYLLIGALDSSQEYLDRLAKNYPKSKYRAQTSKVSGDNSFALKDWAPAAESYRQYLSRDDELDDRDRVGLKLAECYWELADYAQAATVLQDVSQKTQSPEIAFRARLLQARVHVRMGDYEIVKVLLDQVRDEAAIYRSEGEVVLVEAESLIAQDRAEDAAPLLESMPAEWETPDVKARAAEIMGEVFLERGEWDKAREQFQTALLKKDVLEDEDRVRRLNENLKDYLAAEQALPDAKGERLSRLHLLQANSLLFGFERPRMAAQLYGLAAVDSAADTTVAARALYGAYLTYERYLSEPDSAQAFRLELETRFPDSPQAFEARADSGANLFAYLLAARADQQAHNLANLSIEQRLALQELSEGPESSGGQAGRALDGVRRRMVYLGRRDNIVFPPPETVIQMITDRQAQRIQQRALDAARQSESDSLRAMTGAAAGGADSGTGPLHPAVTDTLTGAIMPVPGAAPADSVIVPADQDDKPTEEKKKKDDDWDFLR